MLIPDLEGNWDALEVIVQARPEVLNHNTETVPRLYRRVRPYANYQQTLTLLQVSKQLDEQMLTKSGVMVGLGETVTELLETMQDIRNTECDILTIGQYLSPSPRHLPIQRYYTPEEFDELKEAGIEMGISACGIGTIGSEFLPRRRAGKIRKKLTVLPMPLPQLCFTLCYI